MADRKGDPRGERTEQTVISTYRSLGYEVVPDSLVEGSQSDLVVQKAIHGVGPVRLLVEVKYREEGSVGKDEVVAFCNVARLARDAGRIDRGVMVTNAKFSRFAKASAENSPVQLITLDELMEDVVGVSEALYRAVAQRQAEPITGRYIDLTARRTGTAPKGFRGAKATVTS
jgi:Holliday junction resolvase